ncbi:MAG: glycosyl hydrolase family 43 [Paenibacillus sp.]|nr:glycosyl hydrolase family 43 [Paenibacillus sp.]
MDGYFVWCGSVIRGEDGNCHMFASRWPKETGFPDGYRTHSEIVRAVSPTAEGPYTYAETVIQGRGGDWWDAQMAHNPTIVRSGNTYVLYYLGAQSKDPLTRKIGCAWSSSLEGPWRRSDEPCELAIDSNNPAACIDAEGRVRLAFRYGKEMKLGLAVADTFRGPYTVVNPDVLPGKKLEDPYLFRTVDGFEIIAEDNGGQVTGHSRYGAHLQSRDGLSGWTVKEPAIAYDHAIAWDDGTTLVAERRERPQLIFNEHGVITHLCTAVLADGDTWNVVQPLKIQ